MDTFRQAVAAMVETLAAGGVVLINADAVYYNGKEIPHWLVNEQWIENQNSKDKGVNIWKNQYRIFIMLN